MNYYSIKCLSNGLPDIWDGKVQIRETNEGEVPNDMSIAPEQADGGLYWRPLKLGYWERKVVTEFPPESEKGY